MSCLLPEAGTRSCTEVNMAREIPREVKAGEVVSAAWLNSIVAYLRYLNEQQLRRRILRGVGYQAKESAGGTSLTIDKQSIARICSDDLDIHRNEDFQLRIKPKHQCEVDVESGHWDKIVQVHVGRVTDHHGHEISVRSMQGKDAASDASKPPTTGGSVWDAGQWVDVGVIKPKIGTTSDSGSGDSGIAVAAEPSKDTDDASTKEVFVRLTVSGSVPQKAVFATKKESGTSDLYIPIGKVQAVVVEEFLRIYMEQYQQGPIELGGEAMGMPFDVSMSKTIKEPIEEGEEPEVVYKINVESGRIFMPDRQFAEIPRKEEMQVENIGGSTRYVTLTLTRDGSGKLKYKYTLEPESVLGTKQIATEEESTNG